MFIELMFTFLFFLFILINWQMLWRRFQLPPGPFPWPIVGNLFQLDTVNPHVTMYKWSKIYGPLFTMWMGPEPTIIITDYKLMKEAMIKYGDRLASRPKMFVYDYLTKGNFGIGLSNGEAFKEQRRFTLHVLRNFGLGRNVMEKRILLQAEKLVDSIRKDAGSKKQIVLDLSKSIHLCITNVMSSILFDYTFEKGDKKIEFLKDIANEWFLANSSFKILLINSFPWLRRVPLFGHFGMDNVCKVTDILYSFFDAEFEKHDEELKKNENDDEEPKDFLNVYLKEMKRRQRVGENMSSFSDWQLRMIAVDLWMAGIDTTATTFSWAILAMIKYPRVQQKVHQEIDAILGRERLPTMADRQSMPYVMATLNEVDRWGNVTPINFYHSNDASFRLGGYNIPRGMTVIPQVSVLAIDEKVFPQPEQFRPERFLDEDEKTLRKVDEFAPFGMGKRQCTGEGMARTEMFLIFVYLMQKFRLCVPPGQEEPTAELAIGRLSSAPVDYECLVTLR